MPTRVLLREQCGGFKAVYINEQREAQRAVLGDSKEPVSAVEDMKRRLKTSEGKKLYAKRKSTIEPVFGVIKHVMGFRQFLRGVGAVQGEWNLVVLATT